MKAFSFIALGEFSVAMILAGSLPVDKPKPHAVAAATPEPQPAIVGRERPEPLDCSEVFKHGGAYLVVRRASDGRLVLIDPCRLAETLEFAELTPEGKR